MAQLVNRDGVTVFDGTISHPTPFALGESVVGDFRIYVDVDGALTGNNENGSTAWLLRTEVARPGLSIVAPDATLGVVDSAVGRGLVVSPATNLMLFRGYTSAPNDGDFLPGDLALWFDATAGAAKLKIRACDANGTMVGAELPLTP